jgi:hypothetical protein
MDNKINWFHYSGIAMIMYNFEINPYLKYNNNFTYFSHIIDYDYKRRQQLYIQIPLNTFATPYIPISPDYNISPDFQSYPQSPTYSNSPTYKNSPVYQSPLQSPIYQESVGENIIQLEEQSFFNFSDITEFTSLE